MPLWLDCDALRFRASSLAQQSRHQLRDQVIERFRAALGDASFGWVITLTTDAADVPVGDYTYALLIVQDGPDLDTVTALSPVGNPFPLMGDLAARMVARSGGPAGITLGANGLHHGGLWDILPTLRLTARICVQAGLRSDGERHRDRPRGAIQMGSPEIAGVSLDTVRSLATKPANPQLHFDAAS